MSLQVQSNQQPPSGRRTPQLYQNFGSPTTTTSSKLSLKATGTEKPAGEAASAKESPTTTGKDKSTSLVVSVTKLSASAKVAEQEKVEKVTATNGSTNGDHSEKETNGKAEETVAVTTPVKPASEPTKKEDEKEKKVKQSPKASPNTTPQKQPTESVPAEQIKTAEDTDKKSTESPPVTPEQKKKEKPSVENSLIAEKTLKGFTADGEEMESLVVEPSEYEDSPMPPRTGGKSKLLKYATGPLTRARISPYRVHEITSNASTVVNLSTVSEGQTSAPESNEASPATDFNRPLRTISGRRSTRPISDIQFSYRKSTELNDSTSSMNVTIGSEIHNDSLRTPAPGSSRKRKAMTPESTSDALDVQEIVDSPKRGRLDFSGLLGIVASPVTLLKNRLSRVRLHASTPVAKRSLDDEELSGGVVTAEATTTTANISGESSAKMEVESGVSEEKIVEVDEKIGDGEQLANKAETIELPENATDGTGSEDGSETVVVKDVTDKQRQFCVVM
ncbi:mucin-2-like [Topomyia yanbarensis]|uniref:mucin-2-like n=1 Tax=Topomyia yanbarensis TaxID=2498891 RepID=UPI00273B45F2|nr:mucin-2-like [Topomyia yanbarensis]XP_058811916.1 mucin-2-like [Topomyia yanbarensis]